MYVSIYVRLLLQTYTELRHQNRGQGAYDIKDIKFTDLAIIHSQARARVLMHMRPDMFNVT
jgi:hypothetical protein